MLNISTFLEKLYNFYLLYYIEMLFEIKSNHNITAKTVH